MERLSRLGPLIGKGASACVYQHPDRQEHVVKILRSRPHLFAQEEAVLRQLPDYPGLCQCLETVMIEDDGQSYPGFVFPVYGKLDLNTNYLNSIGSLQVVASATLALIVAHQRGIVHRDIKTENLMCLSDGTIVLIDFGSAGKAGEIKPRSGTPGYKAPEVLLGQAIDQRADIFSLGVVLYELIIEENPLFPQFEGNSPSDIRGNLRFFWNEVAQLGKPLDPLIKKMTAFEKEDRFRGAAETYLAIIRTLYLLNRRTRRS